MNDPRREGAEPTQRLRQPYPPYTDPAYAGQSPYAPPRDARPGSGPTDTTQTAKLPQYWLRDQLAADQPTQQLPPQPPKTPRWLWIAAAAAVLLVVSLIIALVIANGSARKQTAVAPLPGMPNSKAPTSTTSAPPTSMPSSTASSTPTSPSESTSPTTSAGAVDPVVYSVTGEGRAISITYRDSGGVTQTEFNVALPWTKEVNLPKSGDNANVTIVNIGHNVTCTLTVAGVQVRQRTGAGLTICDAPA